jgi:CRP-like cAMP-binding protein
MEDDKKKSLSRRYKEQLLVYSRKHPRTLKWLEKKLAKEIEISDEKYKEFNQSPLYRFYSTEAATRVTPSMHYERFAKDAVVALPDPSAVYLVYVVRGNIRLLRRNPKARGKKKTVRLCTFTGGSYFYRVRGGSAYLQASEANTVVLASRVDSMFSVAMRYRRHKFNKVQPQVLVAATLNLEKMLGSIAFFDQVCGGKIADVAQMCKMEIRNGGETIVQQSAQIESFWMLLAGTAEMSVVDDETMSYHGESSLGLLTKLLDRPLEAFLTDRTHMSKKLTESDVRFATLEKPTLRTETACKIDTFPVTQMPPSYAFDSRRYRIRSRTISNFARKDDHELKEERRKARQGKSGFGHLFQRDETKIGAPEIQGRLHRRFGQTPTLAPILPADDQMTRFFKIGHYDGLGMNRGVKPTLAAKKNEVSNVPLAPGSHFGSVELCGLTQKVSKFTVTTTDDTVWLRIHKKSFQKYLEFEKGIKFKYYRFLNLPDASVRREFEFNHWRNVDKGESVSGKWSEAYAPKVTSLRQLNYGIDHVMDN